MATMSRDQFIQALVAAGISSSAAQQAAAEIAKVGATWYSAALANNIAAGLRTNPNVSAVTVTELRKVQQSAAPAPSASGGSTTTYTSGSRVGQASAEARAKYIQERTVADAWRLLKGEWDQNGVPPGREVIDTARQLQNFLDGMNDGGDPAPDALSDYMSLVNSMFSKVLSGGAGGGGGGGAPPLDPVDTPEEIDDYVRRNYGGYMIAYLQNPEIGPILRQAATEGWDDTKLQGALSNTTWWKSTSATARTFDADRQMDPATNEAKVQDRLAEIRRQASLLGLSITGKVDIGAFGTYDRDYFMAVQSLREGWSANRIAEAIFHEGGFDPNAAQQKGQIKASADDVIALASDYFLTVSNGTANDYARQLMLGTLDMDGLESMFREQAQGRFPGLAEQIKKGIKPKQFFDTYQQQIGSMLEIDADQVDLMSARWMPVVDTVGADGTRRPMTMGEVADYVRKTPEWDKTDSAYEQAVQFGEVLGKTFGKVG